jgi:hypothetical protein
MLSLTAVVKGEKGLGGIKFSAEGLRVITE